MTSRLVLSRWEASVESRPAVARCLGGSTEEVTLQGIARCVRRLVGIPSVLGCAGTWAEGSREDPGKGVAVVIGVSVERGVVVDRFGLRGARNRTAGKATSEHVPGMASVRADVMKREGTSRRAWLWNRAR